MITFLFFNEGTLAFMISLEFTQLPEVLENQGDLDKNGFIYVISNLCNQLILSEF